MSAHFAVPAADGQRVLAQPPLELRLFLPGYCPRGFGRAPSGPRIHRRLRDHDLAPRFLLAAALPLPQPPTTPGFE
jgi:hypothetical protein